MYSQGKHRASVGQAPGKRRASDGQALGKRRASAGQAPGKRRASAGQALECHRAGLKNSAFNYAAVLARASSWQAPGNLWASTGKALGKLCAIARQAPGYHRANFLTIHCLVIVKCHKISFKVKLTLDKPMHMDVSIVAWLLGCNGHLSRNGAIRCCNL
jgi:hypothetical protein